MHKHIVACFPADLVYPTTQVCGWRLSATLLSFLRALLAQRRGPMAFTLAGGQGLKEPRDHLNGNKDVGHVSDDALPPKDTLGPATEEERTLLRLMLTT